MLYCITANYTPKAMEDMGKNPNTNRREAVEKLVTAASGKLVAMYGTIADGPGAMVIVDVPASSGVAAAITAVVASSDGVQNVKSQRLFSMEEITAIRKKRVELQASYKPPGH
jgi:uncharacterized protein with GYD domain